MPARFKIFASDGASPAGHDLTFVGASYRDNDAGADFTVSGNYDSMGKNLKKALRDILNGPVIEAKIESPNGVCWTGIWVLSDFRRSNERFGLTLQSIGPFVRSTT